jgi:hypothetical protein
VFRLYFAQPRCPEPVRLQISEKHSGPCHVKPPSVVEAIRTAYDKRCSQHWEETIFGANIWENT